MRTYIQIKSSAIAILILLIFLLSNCASSKSKHFHFIGGFKGSKRDKASKRDSIKSVTITFCCTNHSNHHCGRADELAEFKEKYSCTF